MIEEVIHRINTMVEPNRDLDREVLFVVMPKERTAIFDGVKHVSTMTAANGDFWFNPLNDRTDCPHYTEDAEDALGLVPEDYYIKLERYSDGWYAEVAPKSNLPGFKHSQAMTAAAAIVGACLRAKIALTSREREL